MLNITSNPALKLALGVASATIAFTSDGTPGIQFAATSSASGTNMTASTGLGMAQGDFVSIEGGGAGGTVPWLNLLGSSNLNFGAGSQSIGLTFPSVKTAVSNATAYRYERFETRYRAKKITLTNLTNGDVYVWDTTLLDDQAKYTPSGGSTTTLTSRGILNRSNCIAIHPNLLPVNCSFTLKCDYDFYS